MKDNTRQKNIIHVVAKYPPALGGMEQRVQDISTKLSEAGWQVTVLTSDQATYPHTEIVNQNLQVEYLRSIEILQAPIIWSLPLRLWKISKRSIVHVHVAQPFVPELTAIICKLRSIPFIAHVRIDLPPSTLFGKIFLGAYKNIFLKPALRSANRMIVLTKDYADIMSDKYGIDHQIISVIPNATDFPIRKPASKVHKPIKILLVGRLSPQKNIPLIIEAAKVLKEEGVAICVSIAGSGDEEEKLLALVNKYDLKEEIRFLGGRSKEELITDYSDTDLVIQTSNEEAFSSVLIEAMTSAKPLIATDIPGTKSIVKDGYNGLLISPRSTEELVNAIKKLIYDQALRENLVNNGLKAVRKYSWDEVVKNTEKVYEKVLF
jgi:glycosyltransferase involved in cell wall biosynthesis